MIGLSEMVFYLFSPYLNEQMVVLKNDVDEAALKKALEKTIEVHPWAMDEAYEENAEIFFRKSQKPFELIENEGAIDLGNERVGGKLIGVTFKKNKIWVFYSHLLTDGTGRMMFYKTLMYYYFCIKNKKEYENIDALTSVPDGLYDEPFAKKLPYSQGFSPKAPEPEEAFFKFPELSADQPDSAAKDESLTYRYNFTVSSSDFMAYVKKNGMSPAIAFELLLAKSVQELFPENKLPVKVEFPVNVREVCATPATFKNAFVNISQKIRPDQLSEDDSEPGKKLRAEFKEAVSPDNLKVLINSTVDGLIQANKYHTIKEKFESFCKTSVYADKTCIFTYMGRFPITDYSDEIENSMWFSYAPCPIISMVDMSGKFSITINTQFDFSKYALALQSQFEKQGIKLISSENIGKAYCKRYDFNRTLFMKN